MEIMPHLKLSDELNIKYAILPGDPARVDRIAEQLEEVQPLAYNREYKSIRGLYKGLPVLAVSTGIGGPSTGIAVEELSLIHIFGDTVSRLIQYDSGKRGFFSGSGGRPYIFHYCS